MISAPLFISFMVNLRKIIGGGNEQKVVNTLRWLKEQGKIDGIERSRSLDLNGVDVIAVIGSKKYKIQVKSSEGGIAKEREAQPGRYLHEDVIFVVPGLGERRESLAERILGKIEELEERMHQ